MVVARAVEMRCDGGSDAAWNSVVGAAVMERGGGSWAAWKSVVRAAEMEWGGSSIAAWKEVCVCVGVGVECASVRVCE